MDEWFIFPACLLHQGWLKLIEVSLVGTFSFTAFSQPAWNSCHSIFPLVLVLYLAVNWVPTAFRSVCDWPTLARLHKLMVRRLGLVRFAVMFETAMVISWSLSPSTGMHLVTGVCLFVKKQVKSLDSQVRKSTNIQQFKADVVRHVKEDVIQCQGALVTCYTHLTSQFLVS